MTLFFFFSFPLKSSEDFNYTCSFLVRLHGPEYCVTVKCCLFLHSDRGVLLLCSACLLDLFSFSLFSILTVCSGPALGNTRSYKLLDWNSVTAGISSPFTAITQRSDGSSVKLNL